MSGVIYFHLVSISKQNTENSELYNSRTQVISQRPVVFTIRKSTLENIKVRHNMICQQLTNQMNFYWKYCELYSENMFHSTLTSNLTIRQRKLFSFDLRKAELASVFRSRVISTFLRTSKIGQMTFNHSQIDQDRGNRPC